MDYLESIEILKVDFVSWKQLRFRLSDEDCDDGGS